MAKARKDISKKSVQGRGKKTTIAVSKKTKKVIGKKKTTGFKDLAGKVVRDVLGVRTKKVRRSTSGANVFDLQMPRSRTRKLTVALQSPRPVVVHETNPASEAKQRVILLPPRGLRADSSKMSGDTSSFFLSLNGAAPEAGGSRSFTAAAASVPLLKEHAPGVRFQVIGSIAENGAKLVEISPRDLADLRMAQPGLRIAPLLKYETCFSSHRIQVASSMASPNSGKITITVVSSAGKPVSEANVVAFTNFVARAGAQGTTDSSGNAELALPSGVLLERIYVYPHNTYWPKLVQNVTAAKTMSIDVKDIAFPVADAQRHFYKNSAADDVGRGVVVGVIDTGCGPHPDLVVAGGYCAVGTNPAAYHDNGDQHGTHVAGIIAARGNAATSVRGISPGVTLRSYRVFGKPGEATTNFDIADAVDQARRDKCDLINLSLKQSAGQVADDALRAAIEDARNAGMLPIAAAGNDGRQPVAFPASDDLCIAVSAMGRIGTFPADSVSAATNLRPPHGADQDDFIADFSNIGGDVDLTSPGVGTISTVPGGKFAVMDGTSMACPVVTGVAARLLSKKSRIMAMARDSHRADAIAQLLLSSALPLGFGAVYEGRGKPG